MGGAGGDERGREGKKRRGHTCRCFVVLFVLARLFSELQLTTEESSRRSHDGGSGGAEGAPGRELSGIDRDARTGGARLVRRATGAGASVLASMGLLLFTGRVLFSAIFVLAAWQKINDFGRDGGAAVRALEPKYALFEFQIHQYLGISLPPIEPKHLLIGAIGLEGLGGILFMFGSTVGAYLLLIFLAAVTPIMHDFYRYDFGGPDYVNQFMQFLKNLSLFGALLFFLALKNSATKRRRKTKTA